MSGLASLALQTAAHARLTGDAALMDMVNGVFDHVPKSAELPYLLLGAVTAQPWSSKTFSGQRHRLTLSVFSEAKGDREIKTLADLAHGLLDRASLPLDGHRLVALDFEALQTLRQPDGVRQAQLRFTALTHPL